MRWGGAAIRGGEHSSELECKKPTLDDQSVSNMAVKENSRPLYGFHLNRPESLFDLKLRCCQHRIARPSACLNITGRGERLQHFSPVRFQSWKQLRGLARSRYRAEKERKKNTINIRGAITCSAVVVVVRVFFCSFF